MYILAIDETLGGERSLDWIHSKVDQIVNLRRLTVPTSVSSILPERLMGGDVQARKDRRGSRRRRPAAAAVQPPPVAGLFVVFLMPLIARL